MEKCISNVNYKVAELQIVSVHLNMPYQFESTSFELVNGQIEIGGITYHYVKRKIFEGRLILIYLPNGRKQAITNAGNAYSSLINETGKYPLKGSPLTSAVRKLLRLSP